MSADVNWRRKYEKEVEKKGGELRRTIKGID
jgi:hypothetical protein